MNTLLTCALVQWLQVYNKRATGFIAQLLGATQLGSVLRKCLTLVTPAGIHVRTIHIEKTTTVADIVSYNEQLYTADDYSSPLHPTLCLWDHVEDGSQLVLRVYIFKGITDTQFYIPYEKISCVSWHPHGKWLACGLRNSRICIWDIGANKPIIFLAGHNDIVFSLSWHPSGKYLASASESEDKTIRIWNTQTWKCINNATYGAGIRSIFWHPSGKWLFCLRRQTLYFLDLVTLAPAKMIECPEGAWNHISWHPTKNQFASASRDRIRIWNMEPLKCIRILKCSMSDLTSICWHPSGKWLASASNDKIIRIWDMVGTNTPQIIQAYNHMYLWDIDWSPDGTRLVGAFCNSDIQIWK